MKDRQHFQITRLANTSTLFEYPTEDPFCIISVIVPIGNAHNVHPIPNGTIHLFEHIVFHRSRAYPEKDSFTKWLAEIGADINAYTSDFTTTYILRVPAVYSEKAYHGMYSMIFESLFDIQDLELERSIIANESQQAKWYPGTGHISAQLWSKWLNGNGIAKSQVYGSSADLSQISIATLESLQALYNQLPIRVVAVGQYNREHILESLTDRTLSGTVLPMHYENIKWQSDDMFTFVSPDVESPIYFFGSVYPNPTTEERLAISFLFGLLTDPMQGVLYAWLREELGWTYSIGYSQLSNHIEEVTILEIPLAHKEQTEIVRRELQARIVTALADKSLLNRALTRQLGQMVFHYQSLEQIAEDAITDIIRYGTPITETQIKESKSRCTDTDYIRNIYETFFTGEKTREALVTSDL